MTQSEQKKKVLSRFRRAFLGVLSGGLVLSGVLYAAGMFPSLSTPPEQTPNGAYSIRLTNISQTCPTDNFIKGFDANYTPICVPYTAPNTSISSVATKSFSEPLSGGMPGGKFGTYFNNLLNICSGDGVLKGFTSQGKKICVNAIDRTTITDSPTDTSFGVSNIINTPLPAGEPTGGKFQTFFTKMFSAPCGAGQWVTWIQFDGTLMCSPIPIPPCVVSSCSAAAPACETTSYGTDNCGGSCSKVGGVCSAPVPPSCTPHACDAPAPACEQTTYGTSDSCGTSCSAYGGPCGTPVVPAEVPPPPPPPPPAACVSNGSCNAPAPACETTTYGTDNCGNSCSKAGGACAPILIWQDPRRAPMNATSEIPNCYDLLWTPCDPLLSTVQCTWWWMAWDDDQLLTCRPPY